MLEVSLGQNTYRTRGPEAAIGVDPEDLVREQAKRSPIPKEWRERDPLNVDIRVVRRRYDPRPIADEVRRLWIWRVREGVVPLGRAEVPLGVGRAVRLVQRVRYPVVLAKRVRRVLEPGCLDEVERGEVIRRGEPLVVDVLRVCGAVFEGYAGNVKELQHGAVVAAWCRQHRQSTR